MSAANGPLQQSTVSESAEANGLYSEAKGQALTSWAQLIVPSQEHPLAKRTAPIARPIAEGRGTTWAQRIVPSHDPPLLKRTASCEAEHITERSERPFPASHHEQSDAEGRGVGILI